MSTTARAGTAMACPSSGRSRRSSAPRAAARTRSSKAEFRARCRDYAADWIAEQSAEFQRLGVLGDWAHRYATMDFAAEAAIVAEFHKFVASGQVYRGSKPVMWSPVERTALADAEIEYHDHVSPTVWVQFPGRRGPQRSAAPTWSSGRRRPGPCRPTARSPTIRTIAYALYRGRGARERPRLRALGQARRAPHPRRRPGRAGVRGARRSRAGARWRRSIRPTCRCRPSAGRSRRRLRLPRSAAGRAIT